MIDRHLISTLPAMGGDKDGIAQVEAVSLCFLGATFIFISSVCVLFQCMKPITPYIIDVQTIAIISGI